MPRSTPTSLLLRRMTASAVLDALRSGGPMTGSDLIDATGLARPTVHVVCNDLIRLGWIRETGQRRPDSRRGRPARVYEFQSRAGFVLGIDATDRVTVRLADLRGDRVASSSEPLDHVSVPAGDRLAAVRRQIGRVLALAGVEPSRVLAVTVGVPTSVDDDGRPLGREVVGDGRPDALRRAGDECRLPLERREGHAAEICSSSLFSESRLLTEIVLTLRSIRFTSPESTFPGPTSTNERTPSPTSSRVACVNLTGAVSWSTISVAIRCAGSIFAVTVEMKGATGSANRTRSTAGFSRSAARATSGLWNAPETFSLTARFAPSSWAAAQQASTAPCAPETTIWPGQL